MAVLKTLLKLGISGVEALRHPKQGILQILPLSNNRYMRDVVEKYQLPQGIGTIDICDVLGEFEITVEPYSFLEGGSPVLDIALLKGLASKYSDCDFLEIGTWRGESIANVASNAKYCVSVSLSDEQIKKQGWTDDYIKTSRVFSKTIKNVHHVHGNSQTFDFKGLGRKFDIIFIDGSHSYDDVKKDSENAFRLLKNEKSIIVWHDYCRSPERGIRWEILAAILDGTTPVNRQHLYRISNTLCAIFTNSKYQVEYPGFPAFPKSVFDVKIKAKKL